MTTSEEILVRQLDTRRGEHAARALYRMFAGELYGFAVARLKDPGLAEEVVQDVFTRVWRHAREFEADRGSVRAWLYGIARNAIIDAERRRARRLPVGDGRADERSGDDEPIERAVLRWQVQLAFGRLTAEHREIVGLVHFRGLKLREIADQTGLPLGTVKSRTYYAMQSFRLALEELGVSP